MTETETETETTAPETLIAKGTLTDIDDESVTLDDKDVYNIKDAKTVEVTSDDIGQIVFVEYTDGTMDAVTVYLDPDNAKAIGDEQSSGMGGAAKAAIILALIAIAIAIVIVVMRNRRKQA